MENYEVKRTTFNKRLKRATVVVHEKTSWGKFVHRVRIEPCHESFEQYGAPVAVLRKTLPIAERLVRTKFMHL